MDKKQENEFINWLLLCNYPFVYANNVVHLGKNLHSAFDKIVEMSENNISPTIIGLGKEE